MSAMPIYVIPKGQSTFPYVLNLAFRLGPKWENSFDERWEVKTDLVLRWLCEGGEGNKVRIDLGQKRSSLQYTFIF